MHVSDDTAVDHAVASRPFPGEFESGDRYAVIQHPRGTLFAVADGLGHGYEAAVAAKLAMQIVTGQAQLPLLSIVKSCHEALVRTRGVALIIASLESSDETMTWLSIGNVAGLLLRVDGQGNVQREHVVIRNGVVGNRLPSLRAATVPLRHGDLLIFATDGVREGFQDDVRLDACPQETADRILAQYGRSTDDALVLVGRWNGPPAPLAT